MEMKIKVVVRVLGVSFANGSDTTIASRDFDHFDIDEIDACISELIDFVLSDLAKMKVRGVGIGDDPQISLILSASEGDIRPALHLSRNTIAKIASIGASFDFDPYV